MLYLLLILPVEGLLLLILCGTAGRFDLPWVWAVVAVHALGMGCYLSAMGPELRRERLRPGGKEHDPAFRLALIPLMLAHLILAGLDLRYGWSGEVWAAWRVAGLAAMAGGLLLVAWAVYTNRFFSSVVRIQDDRGHRVITTGPYAFVRHPGYMGMLACAVGGAVAIGSWWSLVPLLPLVVVLAARAFREERLLIESLAGYAEYAQNVRFRLLPGVW